MNDDRRNPRSAARRRVVIELGTAMLAATGLVPSASRAAAYPERLVRVMVGYSAGGGVDIVARLLAPRLSAELGQSFIVENRTGAAGAIAAEAVAKAPPDGYTLFLGESATLIAPFMKSRMSFDPIRSFTPVAGVFRIPFLIVANNDFPARTPQELVATLKAKPGFYSYASSGIGTVQHLAFEILKKATGTDVVHVPYRGAAQIIPDVISGSVPLAVVSAGSVMQQVNAGRLRAIALMSPDKLSGAEKIPALADTVPGFDAAARLFVLAPASTPADVVERLTNVLRKVMSDPTVVAAAAQQGAVAAFLPPVPLSAALAEESKTWGAIIREQKITSD